MENLHLYPEYQLFLPVVGIVTLVETGACSLQCSQKDSFPQKNLSLQWKGCLYINNCYACFRFLMSMKFQLSSKGEKTQEEYHVTDSFKKLYGPSTLGDLCVAGPAMLVFLSLLTSLYRWGPEKWKDELPYDSQAGRLWPSHGDNSNFLRNKHSKPFLGDRGTGQGKP